jgi:FkbM family methyltransferase
MLVMFFRLLRVCKPLDVIYYLYDFFCFSDKNKRHIYVLKNNLKVSARNQVSDRGIMLTILSGDEYRVLKKYEKLFSNREIILIDAGANIGTFSLFIHNLFKLEKTIALEPDRGNFDVLVENFRINGLRGYVTLNKALYKNDLPVRFSTSFANDCKRIDVSNGDVIVDGISINSIFRELGDEIVDIFKIDIEGGEWNLFDSEDVQKLLSTRCRLLIVEYHLNEEHKDYAKLIEFFEDFDADIYENREKSGLLYFVNKKLCQK